MAERINITTPVGRIVMGNLYSPMTQDAEGKPLTIKTGPNAGSTRVNYFFAIAIPKNAGETHWAQTAWGRQIYDVGTRAFPQASQAPSFAWKIEDGDSQVPNKKGRKPCDNEGWRGNWIVKFGAGFAPKIYRAEGGGWIQIVEENFVKPGYFVQVAFNVEGNASQQNPGVYLNHSMVCFSAYGPEIVFGPDVKDAGFGQAALPAGASLVPVAATTMPALPLAPQSMPGVPAGYPAPMTPPALPGAFTAPPAPVPVMPNPQFLQVQPPPNPGMAANGPGATIPAAGVIPAPPAPASPSSPRMTEKANGASRDAYIAAGWSDAQLIANGLMVI